MTRKLKPGDHVVVPFGLEKLEAVVLRVSETTTGYVTVRIEIEGSDEPFITGYPRDKVTPIAA